MTVQGNLAFRLSRSIIPKKFVPVEIDRSEQMQSAAPKKQAHHPEMALFRERSAICDLVSSDDRGDHEKRAAGYAEEQANNPKRSLPR
jgi:hypothetical protein